MADQDDRYWEDFPIPFNTDDDGFEFVNGLDVAEDFMHVVSQTAVLGQKAEELTKTLADLEVGRDRAVRELERFRREILAANWADVKTSASSEIQDAFIRKCVEEDGRLEEMEELEARVENLTKAIEKRLPRLKFYKSRMKLLEKKTNWAKQYLDYDKLMIRSNERGTQYGA